MTATTSPPTDRPAADSRERAEAPALLRQFPYRLAPYFFGRGGDPRPTKSQVASFGRYATIGDPLADDLVAAMKGPGSKALRAQFEQALAHGIDAVEDAPEPLIRFFEEVENVPYWVDPAALERAADALNRFGPIVPAFLLVGLTGTYTTPDGNAVLLRAGDTKTKAGRRLVETATWYSGVTAPGGMERTAPGFQSTVRIRMTHAFIRSGMESRDDWDNSVEGFPVHQQVYASVIVAFALLPMIEALAFGKWFSRRNREAMFHLWRYVGWLAGVHPAALPTSESDAIRLLWMFNYSVMKPDDSSTELGTALIDAIPEIFGFTGGGPLDRSASWLLRKLHSAVARISLGNEVGDVLGYDRIHPAVAPVLVVGGAAANAVSVLDLIPAFRRRHVRVARRMEENILAAMAERTSADLTYRRD